MICICRTLWLVKVAASAAKHRNHEDTTVKFAIEEKDSVLVKIQTKKRDNRETVDEINEATGAKTGKKIPNKNKGKFVYTSFESIELFETTEQEVKEAVVRGLHSAAERAASAKK